MSAYRRMVVVLVSGALLLSACQSRDPKEVASSPPALPSVVATVTPKVGTVDVLAKDMRVPWDVTFLPDGSALVTERDTKRVLKGTKKSGEDGGYAFAPIATINEADSNGEGGLMGIAASPNYATDQTLFLYYTSKEDNRVASWRIGERPRPIVTGIPISGIHNGGRLRFGPDGFLYVTTGDAAEKGNSQKLDSLGGKILRMTPDGKPAPGNPYDTLVWSYGHRNVQGIGWDSQGQMWATEFGQNAWDEINLIEKGKNYGWPEVEGARQNPKYTDPVYAWRPSESSCSGMAITADDILVVACLKGERLYLATVGKHPRSEPVRVLTEEYGRLRAAVVAPDKSIWVLTNNHDGRGDPKQDDDRILKLTIIS